ncbi:hypothetical protein [Halalkalibacter okhensis]|uniref:hypothetical protein n=1 Tax=Halalkalibacter okhensis TaxID=333138 RepID=UPI000B00B01C|nr:hypothetical protein [Halalkalibacter okhensis]
MRQSALYIGVGYFIGVMLASFLIYKQISLMAIFSALVGFVVIVCLPYVTKRMK